MMTQTSPFAIRALDHAVLPVESLEAARARLSALGFIVAGDARHPFGTENCCVFFADGTYLEPLAVGQREDCEATAIKGNMFTAHDQTYRFRRGENGFSGLAFSSDNADADHLRFGKLGISHGKKLMFGRTMTDANGKSAKATFKLAFALDARAPDCSLFTCQRIGVPKIDRSSMQKHANGVTGIAEIILSEQNPSDFQYFLQDVTGNRDTQSHSFGIEVATRNVNLNVMTPEGMAMHFGVQRAAQDRGLQCEGIVMRVNDRAALESALSEAGTASRKHGAYIVVDSAPGQGAFIAFDCSSL